MAQGRQSALTLDRSEHAYLVEYSEASRRIPKGPGTALH